MIVDETRASPRELSPGCFGNARHPSPLYEKDRKTPSSEPSSGCFDNSRHPSRSELLLHGTLRRGLWFTERLPRPLIFVVLERSAMPHMKVNGIAPPRHLDHNRAPWVVLRSRTTLSSPSCTWGQFHSPPFSSLFLASYHPERI